MKLTLRRQIWRPRPLRSFLGFMDIKTGVTIALLFAVLNKVAGVYGLIAVFTGGSLAQLSMYLYSVLALVVFGWGLKAVTEENPKNTSSFAHVFLIDHLLSTIWTAFSGVLWWVYTPHDGRRVANSDAQREMMMGGQHANSTMTEEERVQAALGIWNKEKGFAAIVLVTGWLIKVYFAMLLYSYAMHLRTGTYRTLPLSSAANGNNMHYPLSQAAPDDEDFEEDLDEFYRPPHTGSSISSFADFVSAPTRGRKFQHKPSPLKGRDLEEGLDEEVLFDEDELLRGSAHSKLGTEESASTTDDGESDAGKPVRR